MKTFLEKTEQFYDCGGHVVKRSRHALNVKVSLEAGQEDGSVVVVDGEVGSGRALLGGRERVKSTKDNLRGRILGRFSHVCVAASANKLELGLEILLLIGEIAKPRTRRTSRSVVKCSH